MSRVHLDWEVVEPLLGPPCPDFCDEGFDSHEWTVLIEGPLLISLHTDQCPICDRGMQVTDMMEYLEGSFKAKLRGELFTFGYETPEYDYCLHIEPTGEVV